MTARRRLDVAMVERGLAETRSRAQALVLEGKVRVAGQVETKASRPVADDAAIEVEAPPRFVSRGGEKLEGAFALWGGEGGLDAAGRICLDVGSSTGGFFLFPADGDGGDLFKHHRGAVIGTNAVHRIHITLSTLLDFSQIFHDELQAGREDIFFL